MVKVSILVAALVDLGKQGGCRVVLRVEIGWLSWRLGGGGLVVADGEGRREEGREKNAFFFFLFWLLY